LAVLARSVRILTRWLKLIRHLLITDGNRALGEGQLGTSPLTYPEPKQYVINAANFWRKSYAKRLFT